MAKPRDKEDNRPGVGVTASSQKVSANGGGPYLRGVAVRRVASGVRGYQTWRVDVGDMGADPRPSGPHETLFDACRRAKAQLDKLMLPIPVRLRRD